MKECEKVTSKGLKYLYLETGIDILETLIVRSGGVCDLLIYMLVLSLNWTEHERTMICEFFWFMALTWACGWNNILFFGPWYSWKSDWVVVISDSMNAFLYLVRMELLCMLYYLLLKSDCCCIFMQISSCLCLGLWKQ